MTTTEWQGIGVRSMARSTSKVEGRVRALGWGLGRVTSTSITHVDLHHPNNKLVSAQLEHLLCTDEPQLELGGSHHLSPYSILCALPWGQHPNVILSWDSQVGSPEILEIGIPATLEAHNVLCKPQIEVRFKAKLYPSSRSFQQYVTRYLHTTKSGRFLIFSGWESNCHNLCFNYPNGSCELILDIYVPRAFQWYKYVLIQWVLTPTIAL
jgi:hypothetical protein